jgi:hypothetical protein
MLELLMYILMAIVLAIAQYTYMIYLDLLEILKVLRETDILKLIIKIVLEYCVIIMSAEFLLLLL